MRAIKVPEFGCRQAFSDGFFRHQENEYGVSLVFLDSFVSSHSDISLPFYFGQGFLGWDYMHIAYLIHFWRGEVLLTSVQGVGSLTLSLRWYVIQDRVGRSFLTGYLRLVYFDPSSFKRGLFGEDSANSRYRWIRFSYTCFVVNRGIVNWAWAVPLGLL